MSKQHFWCVSSASQYCSVSQRPTLPHEFWAVSVCSSSTFLPVSLSPSCSLDISSLLRQFCSVTPTLCDSSLYLPQAPQLYFLCINRHTPSPSTYCVLTGTAMWQRAPSQSVTFAEEKLSFTLKRVTPPSPRSKPSPVFFISCRSLLLCSFSSILSPDVYFFFLSQSC